MPSPHQLLLDFARGLSIQGIEDLHLRLASRQADRRKALLQIIDELIDVSAEAQIVGLVRSAAASRPRLVPARQRPTRKSNAS